MADEFVTRTELDRLEAQLRAEIAQARSESVRRDAVLEERMMQQETAALDMRTLVLDVREALFGDPSKRSGPMSLFERMDAQDRAREQQFAELKAVLQEQGVIVARVRGYERAATMGLRLLTALPVLRWMRAGLGWLFAIAGGVALAVVVMMVLTH